MVDLLFDPSQWAALATLVLLEVVLGIDNIIFISILVAKLPVEQAEPARRVGLFLAMFLRIALLLLLFWIVGLTRPLFTLVQMEVSGRDLILFGGGLFLLWKSTSEIHQLLEGRNDSSATRAPARFISSIAQIALIDLVFSLDSIITAVGIVDEIAVMVVAIVLSVLLMMILAGPIGKFITMHPTIKMLALAFLLVVGVVLIADSFDYHFPRQFIYSALAFSIFVETLNIRLRKRHQPVELYDLHEQVTEVSSASSIGPQNQSRSSPTTKLFTDGRM